MLTAAHCRRVSLPGRSSSPHSIVGYSGGDFILARLGSVEHK